MLNKKVMMVFVAKETLDNYCIGKISNAVFISGQGYINSMCKIMHPFSI